MRTFSKIRNCIILAAGIGRRLWPLTINTPKCLLKINDTTIIERCMNLLRECGVERFFIVVGEKGCWTPKAREIVEHMPYDITIIVNENNLSTESAYSLSLAIEHVTPPILIVDGDVVFSKRLIINLLNDERDTSLVSRPARYIHEAGGRVILDGDRVIAIGRYIRGKFPWHIYSGIIKVGTSVFNALKKEVAQKKYSNLEFVDALNTLCKEYAIYSVEDYRWVNVNTLESYLMAKEVIKIWAQEEQFL